MVQKKPEKVMFVGRVGRSRITVPRT